ncbi:MAG: methylenetetrahydrofolate reductase [Kiritimatiellae bacterium]|nr:methylenetetrahydrofolate reductase [Kiritimatiellia bacterium]
MKISEILRRKRVSLSFEVFPPKKDAPFAPVAEAVRRLCAAKPAFMSVTYGAGGGANVNTLAVAEEVLAHGVDALAHLTCVASSREKIAGELARFHNAGIENILALRGDRTDEMKESGEYGHASDLATDIASHGGFCIGGACYPECHPDCAHLADDIANLKYKVDAGVEFLVTQMFFDNNIFYRYLAKVREAGIGIPVVAGVMPVTNGRQIARIVKLSGTYLPSRFKAIIDRFGDDPAQMAAAGIAYATEQIIDLVANGVNAIHLYTMNKPAIAEAIVRNLGSIIGMD